MDKTELTVLLPGWAGIIDNDINRAAIPHYLTKVLSSSTKTNHNQGLNRILLSQCANETLSGRDLAIPKKAANSIRLDPCYLHPDRDRLLLFSRNLTLTEQQHQQLHDEIAPLLVNIGELTMTEDKAWELVPHQKLDVEFAALEDVEGRAVDSFLPQGNDRSKWLSLWNELQMQLYQADINQQRQAQQQHPINSVWFWGAGNLGSQTDKTPVFYSENSLFKSGDYPYQPLSNWQFNNAERQCLILDEPELEGDWQQQLQQWDNKVFKILWQQLQRWRYQRLVIEIPHYARYDLSPKQCWLSLLNK